jgi:hypothetical protein
MRKVVLSKRAAIKLNKLLEYLDKSLIQIQNFPNSCPQTELVKGLHLLIITKQTSLLYKFDSESIKVVTIIDNRMNPFKLKTEL